MPLSGVLRESECPRCHRAVDLPLGTLCDQCRAAVRRRARGIARRASLVALLAFGLWVVTSVPPERTARLVAAAGGLMIWLLVYTVSYRAAREFLS